MKPNPKVAFTLVEILVVITIISILSGIVLAVIVRVKGSSKESVCASNLHQIGTALMLYAADHDDAIPIELDKATKEVIVQSGDVYGKPWDDILVNSPEWPTAPLAYGATREIFRCPLDSGWTPFHKELSKPDFEAYGTSYINDAMGGLMWKTFSGVANPSSTTLAYDGPNASHGTDGSDTGVFLNCMSYDTHIKHDTRFNCVSRGTKYPGQP